LLLASFGAADEPKNHDFDVIREEAKVPPYQLPPLLVSAEGKPIATPEEWFNIRRPQIMALFGNLVYGVVPQPESPIRTTFEVLKKDAQFMAGQATRKDVRIKFENTKGSAEMVILVFTPNGAAGPVPAFLLHSFGGTRDNGHDANPEKPGFTRNGLPLGEFFKRGFGFVVVPQDALARHLDVILEQPGIQAIQWVQGLGDDWPILQWIPLLKRILKAGKSVLVDVPMEELDGFMEQMPREGVFLCLGVREGEEADVLRRVERWGKRRHDSGEPHSVSPHFRPAVQHQPAATSRR
jgi:hypothetical protein